MSNKSFDNLCLADQILRSTYFPGPYQKPCPVVIRMMSGFELFNTEPYHNYETFSTGYEACDGKFYSSAEDLDDCVRQLSEACRLTDEEVQNNLVWGVWIKGIPNTRLIISQDLERFGIKND